MRVSRCIAMERMVSPFRIYYFVLLFHLLANSSDCFNKTGITKEETWPWSDSVGFGHCSPVSSKLQELYEQGIAIPGFSDSNNLFPPWLNLTLVEVGQRFAVKNWATLSLIHMLSLIYDICIPGAKHTLLVSGATSRVEKAMKRYTATGAHVLIWYQNFVGDPKQREILLDSLQTIRGVHKSASSYIQRKLEDPNHFETSKAEAVEYWRSKPDSIFHEGSFWTAVQKDIVQSNIAFNKRKYLVTWKYNGIPIPQFGQTVTQFSFAGLTVLFHKNLGLSEVTEEELRGFIHLWAFLGNALGLQEKYNVCLEDDLERSELLFREILNAYYVPALFQIDELARIQLSAFLEAMQTSFLPLTPKVLMYKFLRDMVGIQGDNTYQTLSTTEKWLWLAVVDWTMTNRLDFSRWIFGYIGMYGLNVNVGKYFGSNLRSDLQRSKNLYYTEETEHR